MEIGFLEVGLSLLLWSLKVLMVRSYVSSMGDLRRFLFSRAFGLWYLMCCDLSRYGDPPRDLGLMIMVQEVVGSIFVCWGD